MLITRPNWTTRCPVTNEQCGGYPFLDTFFLRSDWTRPNQNKTRLAETDCQIATRKFSRSGHIEVQIINIKSVCRQHSLIHLTYNISTDISSLFSHSKNGLADSFQHIFCVSIEGPTIGSVAGIYAPPVDSLFLENFWVDEGFVGKRGSPFTILF